MATTIKSRIQFRRDTSANWLLYKDVTPYAGEPCFETDTGVFKIGDGVTTYENLEAIGGATLSADGKSIILEEGTFKLAGFDAAGVGAQPRKNADGNIEWVILDIAGEVENIIGVPADGENAATGIYAEVEAINSKIGEVAEDKTLIQMISEATYDDAVLTGRVTTLEEAIAGVYTKEDADAAIATAVAGANHLKRSVVETLPEVADADENVIYMIAKETADGDNVYDEHMIINGAWEKIGDTKVDLSEYAKTSDIDAALANKVDKEDGSRLINSSEIEKLAKLVIDEETGDVGLSGTISAENVVGLADMLAKKVDVADGKSLVDDTLIAKLTAIEDGAQTNKIETIKVGDTILEIADKAVVIPVGAGLKSSEEITVAEDGALGIGKISFSKIIQVEGEEIVFDGGAAG